ASGPRRVAGGGSRPAAAVAGLPRSSEAGARAHHLVGIARARTSAQTLEASRGELERAHPVACQARVAQPGCGRRREAGQRDRRQQESDERLHHGEAAPHWTRTRPRWLTTMRRTTAPASRATVALSAVPTAVKRTRPLEGRLAKVTPGGSTSRSSEAPFGSRISHRPRDGSNTIPTGPP